MITLRPYQEDVKNAVYDHLRTRQDNPCAVVPTAGGKTPIMASICKDAVGLWGGRVLILAHVKELLEQTAEKLSVVCPEVGFGIYSAGLKRRDTDHPVIIASIQSVYKRACELDRFDLILIDEAHLISPDSESMYQHFLADARIINPEVRIVGFTATPYRLKSGPICTVDGILNHICYEVGVRELIRDGFLCPLISKAGRTKVDTSELHVRGGEFVPGEVEALMDQDSLVQSAVSEIIQYTTDRNACLIFASSIQHGKHIVEVLASEHSIECGFVCGETPALERDLTIAKFKTGKLKYLCNVNVLTTGFDAPHIDCVALVRPTMSPGLFYQMCLDMETEVLTLQGWRRCHEVATGDIVAAFDLDTDEIVYTPAVDKVHRSLRSGEKMFGVSAPHLDIRVTDQHTMVVRGRARTCLNWQLQTAADAAERRDSFTIPIAGRGESLQIDAPLSDAEVAFIGWYLTDGYLNRSNNTVTISQSSEKFDSEVRKVLNDCRFGFREYLQTRKGDLERYAHGIQFVIPFGASRSLSNSQRGWADLEGWLDKDIPEIFNSLSARQFSILLDAMNLANGRNPTVMDYIPKVMSISVGCRQRMADRIQQLAIERGFRCNVKRFLQNPSHWNQTPQPQWMLYIKRQCVAHVGGTRIDKNSLEARRCQLRPVEFDRNEWVWCLTTDRGTLVTRRNGKVSILGNCGRGFRLHPSKENCLVLDFGGNVLRHGPVDDIRVTTHDRGDGKAPAKQCPECHALIATGFTTCPQCGFVFPPPDRKQHDPKASEAGILSGQVTTTKYQVEDVYYAMHCKRDAQEGAPRTLRVDYRVGWHDFKSEWVCFEHEGYARQKAIAWWRKRSDDPVPDTVDRALEIIEAGGLAPTIEITVRSVAGEQFERIIDHKLGPIPESLGISDQSDADLEDAPF